MIRLHVLVQSDLDLCHPQNVFAMASTGPSIEYVAGKVENSGTQHFHLFIGCFQEAFFLSFPCNEVVWYYSNRSRTLETRG